MTEADALPRPHERPNGQQPFTPGYRRYALGIFTAVYMLNVVDRSLVSLLVEPIRRDLQLSDTQLGFITGIAFALFYATLGLPMARWADRGNRATITALAMGIWAFAVTMTLLVTNFAQLVIARVCAAVGEAGCTPPTYSLVGDYYPEPAERSRAMAIYISGSTLSALVSLVLGGWLAEHYGWRMTLFIMGVPGALLAILIKLTIVEPRIADGARERTTRSEPIGLVARRLWRNRTCRQLCFALIVINMISYGLSPWYAAFLMRSHGFGTAELGLWLGFIIAIAGTAAVLLGGYVSGTLLAGKERRQLELCGVTILLVIPFLLAFLLTSSRAAALAALIPLIMSANFFFGPVFALIQRLVSDDIRATAMAMILLAANLVGMGLGPQLIGVLSDLLRPAFAEESLRYAMLVLSLIAIWGATHFWLASHSVRDDLLAAEKNVEDERYSRRPYPPSS